MEALAPGVIAEVSVQQPDAGPAHRFTQPAADPAVAPPSGDQHLRLEVSRTLLVDGVPVPLTRREFELLAHLAGHPGVALSRRDLMSAVWHDRYLPGDRTVDVPIRRLRVKFGAYAGRLNTLRGYGYRFD